MSSLLCVLLQREAEKVKEEESDRLRAMAKQAAAAAVAAETAAARQEEKLAKRLAESPGSQGKERRKGRPRCGR